MNNIVDLNLDYLSNNEALVTDSSTNESSTANNLDTIDDNENTIDNWRNIANAIRFISK